MTRDRPPELPADLGADLALEEIVDRCLDEIAAGRLTVEAALARWPEQRDDLAPLLDVAIAMRDLPPVPERAPNPDRRSAFMTSIASTPQHQPRRGVAEAVGSWFAGLTSGASRIAAVAAGAPRIAAIATPAAAIALLAVFFVLGTGGNRASASTLTVFEGAVERQEEGRWVPLTDGATLGEGDRIRTLADGQALLTFQDGSTAALDPSTELVIERAVMSGEGHITLQQLHGRIWNDVAPSDDASTYVVRTVDAVVEAHGTTFETTVGGGVTDVVAASGIVEVAAGDQRVTLEPGQVLRAIAQRIVTDATPHASSDAPAVLRIEGPFVASLRSESGASTGALPNGAIYHQIPGVSTTNPGDGPQILRFFDIAPGRYVLVIRRIDGRPFPGRATFEAKGHVETAELPPELAVMRVRIDIGIDGGIVSLVLVDAEPVPHDPVDAAEQIVDTPRTSDAVAVSDQRAATRPGGAATADPEVSSTSPPSDAPTPRERLQHVLALHPPERPIELRRLLESLGRNETAWATVRRLLEVDAGLRRTFIDALPELEAPLFIAFVRDQLGLRPPDATSEPTSTTTDGAAAPTAEPQTDALATATGASGSDGATRDAR